MPLFDHQWMTILAMWLALILMGYKKYYQGIAYVLVVAQVISTWEGFVIASVVYVFATYIGEYVGIGLGR